MSNMMDNSNKKNEVALKPDIKTPRFHTIRETAAEGVLNESTLRVLAKAKLLPGFSIGSRWYVNVNVLVNMLDDPTELARINAVLNGYSYDGKAGA